MACVNVKLVAGAAEIGCCRLGAQVRQSGRAGSRPYPFTRYEFFEALEQSGSAVARAGWQPAHLVLGEQDAILPTYLKSHSQGEYVFDHSWADARTGKGGDYYPKLKSSVPFTPATGRRFLIARETGDAKKTLLEAGIAAVRQLKASSLHITFMTEEEWQAAGRAGYLLRTDQQFHWRNKGYRDFADFLSELSSAKRKNLRKERLEQCARNRRRVRFADRLRHHRGALG